MLTSKLSVYIIFTPYFVHLLDSVGGGGEGGVGGGGDHEFDYSEDGGGGGEGDGYVDGKLNY